MEGKVNTVGGRDHGDVLHYDARRVTQGIDSEDLKITPVFM